jgi:hypothetical protein
VTEARLKKLSQLAERAQKRNEYLPAVWLLECLDEIERLQQVEKDASDAIRQIAKGA